MKILYIVRAELPNQQAHSVQIFNTCSAFADAGADVSLFAWNKDVPVGETALPGAWPRDRDTYFGVCPNFSLVTPPDFWWQRLFRVSRKRRFLSGGIRHAKHALGKGDVAFTRTPEMALALARAKIFVVLEVHDEDVLNDEATQKLLFEQQLGKACSAFLGVVSISGTLAEALSRGGIPDHAMMIAHDGIDENRFENPFDVNQAREWILETGLRSLEFPPANSSLVGLLENGRPVVGYCGHFYRGRGIDMLIRCAGMRPEWTFLLIGGLEKDIEPYREMVRLDSLTNVIFTGYVPNTRLPPFLWACDVLSMPYQVTSRKSHFMSPMKMFEYMACGRAIVAADWPQIREVLSDGENALLHRPGDDEGLEQALARVIDHPSLRRDLAGRARADVGDYTWKVRGRRIVEWLRNREESNQVSRVRLGKQR